MGTAMFVEQLRRVRCEFPPEVGERCRNQVGYRLRRDVEDAGDLFVREIVKMGEHEHMAPARWQPIQRVPQNRRQGVVRRQSRFRARRRVPVSLHQIVPSIHPPALGK